MNWIPSNELIEQALKIAKQEKVPSRVRAIEYVLKHRAQYPDILKNYRAVKNES